MEFDTKQWQRDYITNQIKRTCEFHDINIKGLSRMLDIDYSRLWCAIHGARVMYPEELINLAYVLEIQFYRFVPFELRGMLEHVRLDLIKQYQ